MKSAGDQTGCYQKTICFHNQHMPSGRWQREVSYMSVKKKAGSCPKGQRGQVVRVLNSTAGRATDGAKKIMLLR